MNNPKISVIVPVYNVEKYLHRCVDSILVQTFTDFELLLIDDGSTDKSGEICEEYGRMDGRVRVFHQENGGVSKARNVGLNHAKGEWVTFCDSDDWLDSDAFIHYIEIIKSDKFDYFCCGYYLNGQAVQLVGKGLTSIVELLGKNDCDKLWNGIYKRKIIVDHHIFFNEQMKFAEDRLFNYQFLRQCKQAYISINFYYHYFFGNSQSLSFKGFDIDNFLKCHILIYHELVTIISLKADTLFVTIFKGLIWQTICERRGLMQLMKLYNRVIADPPFPNHIFFKYKYIFVAYCMFQFLKHKIR